MTVFGEVGRLPDAAELPQQSRWSTDYRFAIRVTLKPAFALLRRESAEPDWMLYGTRGTTMLVYLALARVGKLTRLMQLPRTPRSKSSATIGTAIFLHPHNGSLRGHLVFPLRAAFLVVCGADVDRYRGAVGQSVESLNRAVVDSRFFLFFLRYRRFNPDEENIRHFPAG
jgi:hypothetical protein